MAPGLGLDADGRTVLARDANNLNLLRLLAAFGVVISHCALLREGRESAEPLAGLTYFNLGDYALLVFFFISGLTVSASYARSRSTLDFVVARALRIWPALFAAVLLTVFVVAPCVSTLPPRAFFADPAWATMIAKTVVLSGPVGSLPGVFEKNPLPFVVSGSPWTLRFEAICYAALVLGTLVTARIRPWTAMLWVPAATLAAGCVMILAPATGPATTVDHLLRFWFAFGLGACAYQARDIVLRSRPISAGAAMVLGGAFVVSVGSAWECVMAMLFVGSATLILAGIPTGGVRTLTNRYDLSYGVYVAAWPITQVLVGAVPGQTFATMLGLILSISLGVALMSWVWIERPAMALRRPIVAALERALEARRRHSSTFMLRDT